MDVARIEANGIQIAYESFGDRSDPPLLLVMGLGTQMLAWPEPFCQALAEHGSKIEESERGAPLSAINSALGENLFVAALSNVPVEVDRNIELMLTRSWIDVPVRFASGRRGIITFEKGVPGGQTLADAFGRWR